MVDYYRLEGQSGTLTIPAGQTSATITFETLDDGLEANDTSQFFFVRVQLGPDSSSARVTIRP